MCCAAQALVQGKEDMVAMSPEHGAAVYDRLHSDLLVTPEAGTGQVSRWMKSKGYGKDVYKFQACPCTTLPCS